MKAALQLRQSQQLTLTPQLQQAIRLLQLSTLEITQESARLLDENPFLEREDDAVTSFSSESTAPAQGDSGNDAPERESAADSADNWSEPTFASAGSSDDDDDGYPEIAAERPTLREHLIGQMNLSQLDLRDRQLIGLLIDALDDNGYLAQPLEEILELLPPELDITLDDLETALVQLQHLDEPGIGARNLSECLALQLRDMPEDIPERDLALAIVTSHLDLRAARDFNWLKKALRCDDDALRCAQELIMHLQPKPGAAFEHRAADYVVPDVLVERHGGIWRARMNPEAMP